MEDYRSDDLSLGMVEVVIRVKEFPQIRNHEGSGEIEI